MLSINNKCTCLHVYKYVACY